MKEILLIKYGEIILKGLNRHIFEDRLLANIRKAINYRAEVYKSLSTVYAEPKEGEDIDDIAKKITKVFGIISVAKVAVADKDITEICKTAAEYLKDSLSKYKTFKVETKRADKKFPLKSPQISAEVGGKLLETCPHLKVDVINPEITVFTEVRDKNAYIYAEKMKGPGGMPTGSSGKGMLLLSGGIDSPVAGYVMAKRGMTLEAVHFFSHPFTSEQAKQKVIDLAKILASFAGDIKMHVVPFTEPQLQMREKCPAEFLTILMRRMMMTIADKIAEKSGALALITGESLGQVASQTLEAIYITDACSNRPCFRPLIGMDKEDIVKISRDIDTYETSILPFEDCCTIFVPKHPATRPKTESILAAEKELDFDNLVEIAVSNTETFIVRP